MPDAIPDERTDSIQPGPGEVALFHDLSRWREQLARSIARNNLEIRSDEITEIVNRILFFVVFLQIAGDRGLISRQTYCQLLKEEDPYTHLLDLVQRSGDPWEELDGGLLRTTHAKEIIVEGRVFRPILEQAFKSERASELASIPLSAMAAIFSRYLEQTVKRSATHQATIVDTLDTIHSAGFPARTDRMIGYVVDRTMNFSARNRSKRELLPIRLVDPACGPGMVLLAAFKHLVGKQGGTRCTFSEKRQIMFDSIHGVDANRHAVAAARMLLVLGLMDGETSRSLPGDFFTLTRDAFHDLRFTIRHGNSLVGPGITREDCWMFIPARDRDKLIPFLWQTGFPEIFAAGGFDAIIGNFPDRQLEHKEWVHQYFQRHYSVYDPEIDRSVYFVESGLQLLRPGGALGCCMADGWLRGKAGAPFREFLNTKEIGEILDFPSAGRRKKDAGVCIVCVINRGTRQKKFTASIADPTFTGDLEPYVKLHGFLVDPASLTGRGWSLRDTRRENISAKLTGYGTPLENVVMGQVHTGAIVDPAFVIDAETKDRLVRADPRCGSHIRRLISGSDIGRYRINAGDRFIILVIRGWTSSHPASVANPWRWFKRRHPSVARQLKRAIEDREIPAELKDCWWEGGGWSGSLELRPRILFPVRFQHPAFAYDPGKIIADETVNVIESSSPYLLGLLNSRLIAFVLNSTRNGSGDQPEFFPRPYFMDIPIYTPDLDDPVDRDRHDRMIKLVTRMINLEKKEEAARDEHMVVQMRNEIAALDRKIDALVYDLYELTHEEIAIVEGAVLSFELPSRK